MAEPKKECYWKFSQCWLVSPHNGGFYPNQEDHKFCPTCGLPITTEKPEEYYFAAGTSFVRWNPTLHRPDQQEYQLATNEEYVTRESAKKAIYEAANVRHPPDTARHCCKMLDSLPSDAIVLLAERK